MYVTKLELWNDTGFVENSAEYPNLSDTLTNPDFTYTDLHPAKEDLFSYFKIKGVSYEELISVSYARVTYDSLSYPVYMWVDNVACISESPSKLVGVRVHTDLWRTYLADSSLQYGLVTKRIRGTADPIQSCPYRYRKLASTYTDLIHTEDPGMKYLWGILCYTEESKTSTVTSVRMLTCPVAYGGETVYYKLGPSTTTMAAVSRNYWITSQFDEILGVAPDNITAAFLSPLPPYKVYSGTGTSEDPLVMSTNESVTPTPKSDTKVGSIGTRFLYGYASGSGTAYLMDPGDTSKTAEQSGLTGVYGSFYATITVGSTAYTSSAEHEAFTFAPVDQWVKSSFGEDVFSNLVSGDTVEFSAIFGTVTSFHIDKAGIKNVDGTYYSILTATATNMTQTKKFTFNGSTFGSQWVIVTGFPGAVSLTVTTASSTITSTDFDTVGNTQSMFYRKDGKCDEYTWELPADTCTTDTEEMVILDLDGNPMATTPWGLSLKNYTMRCVLSTVSAYVQIRFDGKSSLAEGLCVNIPCPAMDITTNSWSTYVYSGQRDYDIQQRKIASQQALVSGITGGLQNTVSTGVMGGLGRIMPTENEVAKEAWQRAEFYASQYQGDSLPVNFRQNFASSIKSAYTDMYKGGMSGKVAGGAMMGVSLAGAAVDYEAAQYFNGKLQGIEDTLQAKQLDTVQTPGGGWDFFYHGMTIRLTSLKPDDYSVTNFQNNIQYNGITCSEPTADCSAYKDYTGPVQIQNLIVTGDIPVQAKYLIANTYAKGIRMKCVNEKPDYDITASSFVTRTSIPAGTYVLYNNTDYRYKINCVANDEIREQYIVEAGDNVTVTLEAGDVISTLYYDKLWVANQNTVNVL